MEKPTYHSKPVRLFYFWMGIIATFAYRIIVVLNYYNTFWSQIAWYIGTIGFIFYFVHRYQISAKRAKLIQQYDLKSKVNSLSGLTTDEKEAMDYIFGTLLSSKEKVNSIFIFIMSAIALIWGIYLDFFS
ncbi:hypothetical protein HGA91_03855 [candidate division WWE3 bacterium]|nr:hypothetical protein [candidate division WWE3 bacterium]